MTTLNDNNPGGGGGDPFAATRKERTLEQRGVRAARDAFPDAPDPIDPARLRSRWVEYFDMGRYGKQTKWWFTFHEPAELAGDDAVRTKVLGVVAVPPPPPPPPRAGVVEVDIERGPAMRAALDVLDYVGELLTVARVGEPVVELSTLEELGTRCQALCDLVNRTLRVGGTGFEA